MLTLFKYLDNKQDDLSEIEFLPDFTEHLGDVVELLGWNYDLVFVDVGST